MTVSEDIIAEQLQAGRSKTGPLNDDGIPTAQTATQWRQSYVHNVLGNDTYTGVWTYGKTRCISTDDGTKSYDQPEDTWIEIPLPPLVDEETWNRAQKLKKQRRRHASRNTKVNYLLQHLLKCGECGHNFHAKSYWNATKKINGKTYRYDAATPRRYYRCNGMHSLRLQCREKHYIRAERLEEPVWNEVKRVLQNPDLIIAGIESLDSQEGVGLEEEIAQAERDLRKVQMEEDRAISLYVSGKVTEKQLDHQRRFITERLEAVREKLDDLRAREASGAEKRVLMETVLSWAGEIGEGLDEVSPERRRELLRMVVEEVVIDRNNKVDITLAVPVEDDSVAVASESSSSGSSVGSPVSGSTP